MLKDGGTLRKQKLSWQDRLKIAGKVLLGYICIVRPIGRPIFIFSTRRSGSTLLMNALHSQTGIDYIDEPLNLWRLHPYFQRLPHPPFGYFISLSFDEEKLYTYIRDLLSGKIRFRHRYNLLGAGRTFLVRRFVMKNINATPLIDWFGTRFEADIVYLVRHPGAVAESLVRRGWHSVAEYYLNDEAYCNSYLNPRQRLLAYQVLERGSFFQKCVLEWCLDNLHPLKVLSEQPWLTLSYEELILRPDNMARLLCERLILPDPERISRALRTPSRTTSPDSRKDVQDEGPQSLVTRWLERVTQEDIEGMNELLTAFGIDIYKADDPYPSARLCHFGFLKENAA